MKLLKTNQIFTVILAFTLTYANEDKLSKNERGVDSNPLPNWKQLKPKTCVNDLNYKRPSEPITLNVRLYVKSFYDISEEKMEFGLQVFLIESWKEPYMDTSWFNESSYEIIPNEIMNCLWQPDLVFYNAKEILLYTYPVPNIYTALIYDTNLYKKSRYRLVLSCDMNFHLFPMDQQHCSIEIGLMASSMSEVNLRWVPDTFDATSETCSGGVGIQSRIKPLNFHIEFVDSNVTERFWGVKKQFLYANFLFTRSLVASIVNTYIPSFLVVCLSFVSFWLDVTAVPGRVTLGVTSILTLATSMTIARGSLPTLDYMTAMDVWLLGCVIMVFLSLMEFTMAQSCSRRTCAVQDERVKTGTRSGKSLRLFKKIPKSWWCAKFKACNRKGGLKRIIAVNTENVKTAQSVVESEDIKLDNILDRASRIIFPTSFFSFTVTYWCYFLNESNRIKF